MTYKVKILVSCEPGEVLERDYQFDSFDDMRTLDFDSFVDSAEEIAINEGYDRMTSGPLDVDEEDFSGSSEELGYASSR